MHANKLALGRNHSTADTASLTNFGDCFRVNLDWADGAHVYMVHDLLEDAIAHLASLGFTKS